MAMHETNRRCVCSSTRDAVFFCLLLSVFFLCGCSGGASDVESPKPGRDAPPSTPQAKPKEQLDDGYTPFGEPTHSWKVTQVSGTKIGYSKVSEQRMVNDQDQIAILISLEDETKVKRFSQMTVQKYSSRCLIKESGEMIGFESQLQAGPSIVRTSGKVTDGQLRLKTDSGSEMQIEMTEWDLATVGLGADEYLLRQKPLKPGETREFKMLAPVVHQPMSVKWTAKDYQQISLPDGESRRLMEVIEAVELPGVTLEGSRWLDEKGLMWMSSLPTLNQTTYRTTEANAMADDGGAFDLGLASVVKLKLPEDLKDIHASQRLVYRARLKHANPLKSFRAGVSQVIQEVDDRTVEIEVIAVRPGAPSEVDPRGDTPPNEDDRGPNSLIQSEDERVVAMAQEIADGEAWEMALKLESLVHDRIKTKDFSQAFASAADVAKHLKGDCTEHAVLLAALCRAKRIPARVAMGLVYYPAEQGFAYHMWNEVWIEDRWIPLDATLGIGGIGAGHLRVSTSNLKGASPYAAFLPVLPLIQQLELELIAAP